jgi:ABC-type phosphate transport system substrate-binding protein
VFKTVRSIAAALSVAVVFAGSASAQSVDLTGAGATFPYPIYSKWFSDYAQNTGVKINYQSIGSGGGIRQLSEQNSDILVVHRSDGRGTTYIFTDYLNTVSPSWSGSLGKGKDVKWPVGLGGKGNEGVAGQVNQTPGSIGYVELAYAKQNKLPYANVRNADGRFVSPSIASVTAAAASMKLPKNTDYRVSIVNAPGKDSYPISSMTWILVYQNQPDKVKGTKLVNFLRWAYKNGEKSAATLDYAPLPASMVATLQNRLKTIRVADAQVGGGR